jgi:flavin-dependent dehydrogenase
LTPIPKSTDVFVIGGGPAGLAAAIAARLKGFDVTVADAAQPPIEKACGEGLMPDALAAIERLGVTIGPDQSAPFRGIRFVDDGGSVAADFPVRRGVGIRRIRLHQLLLDRASEVGVRMLWGHRVRGIRDGGALIAGQEIQCRWVIGADGQNSRVRCWGGLESAHYESLRFGFRRHYRLAPWSDYMEIHWGPDHQMYVTPVGREEVCLALITRDSRLRLDGALRCYYPELALKLAGAVGLTAQRGAVTISRRLRRVFRGSTVLVGDASGSVDAITGDGLCLSFRQAIALADALAIGDLRSYESAHRSLERRPAFMGRLMLSLDRSSWLRRRAIKALSSKPEIFANLLAMHVGESSFADFLSGAMLPLGWHILTN